MSNFSELILRQLQKISINEYRTIRKSIFRSIRKRILFLINDFSA